MDFELCTRQALSASEQGCSLKRRKRQGIPHSPPSEPCTPSEFLTVHCTLFESRILFEGNEEHATLEDRLKKINEFLSKHITSDGVWITAWEGGDLKWLCKKAGLSGNFATHDQCLWCEVPRNQLVSLNKYPERTVNSIRVLAHMPPLEDGMPVFPFTCECCSKTFESVEQCAEEIFSPDVLKSYPTLHKGVLWHKGPVSTTPINQMVPCVLHMRLR